MTQLPSRKQKKTPPSSTSIPKPKRDSHLKNPRPLNFVLQDKIGTLSHSKQPSPSTSTTLYDKEGNILTYKKSFASVKAGEEAEFHVMLTSTQYKDIIPEITSYDIKFEC